MIIDDHNHPDWYGYTYDRFIENMEQNHIDKTCLLSWETPENEYDPSYNHALPPFLDTCKYPVSFERCLRFADKSPDKFYLGYAPDPRLPDACDRLSYAYKAYGIKLCGELKLRMMLDNPDAIDLYRLCGKLGLPVIVHIDYPLKGASRYPRPHYWYGGGLEALARACEKCPETNFVGHAPGFWAHISGDGKAESESYPSGKVVEGGFLLKLLDRLPNLFCDISAGSGLNALKRDPDFAVEFLTKYQDRVTYGRDYFDNCHQEFLNSGAFSNDILEKVYHKNIERLIGIGK